jgi:hypothetical protein
MKKLFPIGGLMALAVILFSATSCVGSCKSLNLAPEGDRVTEFRYLKGFEKIEINGSPTVYYTQADSFSVKVTGPENYIEYILTELDGKTLVIRNRGKVGIVNFQMSADDNVSVHVTSPDLISVNLNGSGDFISKQQVDTDDMDINLRGSGDIEMANLLCDHCNINLIGSGDINMKRLESREATATLIGSGDIDLKLLNVLNTLLALKGSGDISADFAQGCKKVECELHGSGEIELSGNVEHFFNQKSGSGDIDFHKLNVEK